MNKKKILLNISLSFIPQIISIVFAIIAKRFLISEVGNDANGLYQLFLSINAVISIVELGVGGGIIFCMYEPIAKGDLDKVSALYYFFKKMYFIIGIIILVIGLGVIPIIPFLAKDYQLNENIYFCYVISLISTFLPYLYSYKMHLINAYKNNYITSIINGIGLLFQYVLQIVFLFVFKSLSSYLWAKVLGVIISWLATEFAIRKYKGIISNKQKIDPETKKIVNKNIKAMFTNKIGYTLINTTDGIIISAFVSVTVLGFYSNYISLSSTLNNLLILFFTPINSIIGSIFVTRKQDVHKYLSFFHTLNFIIGIVFYLGYYAVIDNTINMFYGDNLLLDRNVVKVLVINLYIQYLRQATLTFRDATGSYYYDRWRPVIEGIVNVVLDLILVHFMGITGVFLATIITNVLIADVVEPYVIEKIVLGVSPKVYYIKNSFFIGVFVGIIYLYDYISPSFDNDITQFFVSGFISVGIALVISLIYLIFDKNFRQLSKEYVGYFMSKFKHKGDNLNANS